MNIPHPTLSDRVAGGGSRNFDPSLSGTYRLTHTAVVNPYPMFAPSPLVSQRLISHCELAGLTEHYANSDVINFDDSAKHSAQAAVQPSTIRVGASATNTGTADVSNIVTSIETNITNDRGTVVQLSGSGSEPIVPLAALISWEFLGGITINDPSNLQWIFSGSHKGFPAHEVYINTGNPTFPVTETLSCFPPIERGVLSLIAFLDESIPPDSGAIAQKHCKSQDYLARQFNSSVSAIN